MNKLQGATDIHGLRDVILYHTSEPEKFNQIFDLVEKYVPDVAYEHLLKQLQISCVKAEIQQHLEEGFDPDYLTNLVASTMNDSTIDQECQFKVASNSFRDIHLATDRTNGLHWGLSCLQKSVGNIIKGDFIGIFAYVEVGKTTLAASEVANFALQVTDGSILWLNNEQPEGEVKRMIQQAVLGTSRLEYEEDLDHYESVYKELLGGDLNRILLVDIHGQDLNHVKQCLEHYKPRLVIVDRIDKIMTGGREAKAAKHEQFGFICQQLRQLAQEYCPIIAITQADKSVRYQDWKTKENVDIKYIDFSQMATSHVAAPAEFDVIVGIGKDQAFPSLRYIHVSKNKIGPSNDPNVRNIKSVVRLNGGISRYEDV